MNDKVVYTAIFGGFDEPKPVRKPNPSFDYILFTDDPSITNVEGWDKIIHVKPDESIHPRLQAKRIKILPHKYLPSHYTTSLWIDGSYEIINNIAQICDGYCDSHLAIAIHPQWRNDIYEEAETIMKYGFDTWENMRPQLDRYAAEGFNGKFRKYIYQCGVILRKHHEPLTIKIMESWMEEIEGGSIRDQLSLPYVLWKHVLWKHEKEFDDWNPTFRFSKMAHLQIDLLLKYHPHNKKINNIYFISPYGFQLKIGDRLNKEISEMPEDAWICLTDQDCCFLVDKAGDLINDVINRYPDTDLFSCYTNRLGLSYQRLPEVNMDEFDLQKLHKIADDRVKKYYSICSDIDQPVAGFFMLFSKKTWEKYPFQSEIIDKDKELDGKRGIYFDWDFSYRVLKGGGKIRLIEGLFMLHCYRLNRKVRDITHLIKVI